MGLFERYLTLWVLLCIVVGIGLGYVFPGLFQTVGQLEMANINLPVALLVWLMIIPTLLKIDLRALEGVHNTGAARSGASRAVLSIGDTFAFEVSRLWVRQTRPSSQRLPAARIESATVNPDIF